MSLKLLILLVTVRLLLYGRRRFTKKINCVAKDFGLTQLFDPQGRSGYNHLALDSSGNLTAASPWPAFLDKMQFWPTCSRVFMMTALFFVFGIALLTLDWPFSPHRGELSAWFNHALLLTLLACMMGLLCTVLDASQRTRAYFTHLGPDTPRMPRGNEPAGQGGRTQDPNVEVAMRLQTRFRFAVRLASSVNWFIYLPFIPLLLVLPTHSRVLEAWNISLPFVVLLSVSILLAVREAFALRGAASCLKTKILKKLDNQLEALKQEQDQSKADCLRQIAADIRSVQEGPFRPFTQEPVVRAILLVSGWVGGLSTAEFLFLR
jgi:hypothetical protein